jgi:preprotein translocase subunit SecG
MGGQSAFGTKAGDLFTRITIVVAALWILLSIATIKLLNTSVARAIAEREAMNAAPAQPAKDGKAPAKTQPPAVPPAPIGGPAAGGIVPADKGAPSDNAAAPAEKAELSEKGPPAGKAAPEGNPAPDSAAKSAEKAGDAGEKTDGQSKTAPPTSADQSGDTKKTVP